MKPVKLFSAGVRSAPAEDRQTIWVKINPGKAHFRPGIPSTPGRNMAGCAVEGMVIRVSRRELKGLVAYGIANVCDPTRALN